MVKAHGAADHVDAVAAASVAQNLVAVAELLALELEDARRRRIGLAAQPVALAVGDERQLACGQPPRLSQAAQNACSCPSKSRSLSPLPTTSETISCPAASRLWTVWGACSADSAALSAYASVAGSPIRCAVLTASSHIRSRRSRDGSPRSAAARRA